MVIEIVPLKVVTTLSWSSSAATRTGGAMGCSRRRVARLRPRRSGASQRGTRPSAGRRAAAGIIEQLVEVTAGNQHGQQDNR